MTYRELLSATKARIYHHVVLYGKTVEPRYGIRKKELRLLVVALANKRTEGHGKYGYMRARVCYALGVEYEFLFGEYKTY